MNQAERVPLIDALRGLSCLGILLYHVRIDLWVGWKQIQSCPDQFSSIAKAVAWLSIPTPFLGYAILLFFLISGFCIHYPNCKENIRPNWKVYFLRRFFRIYPTFAVALVLTAGISYLCHVQWADRTWDHERILRVATLTQNYPPGVSQFLANPSLWTIPLEVEFYLLYPVVFCLFSRLRSYTLGLLAVSLCAWSIYLSKQGIVWPSFTALFFWPVWLIGAWMAQLHQKNRLSRLPTSLLLITGGLSLALALTSRMNNWDSWIQYLLWTGFYLLLLVFTLSKHEIINALPFKRTLSILSWLGKISFSLYLVHFPVFKLFGYLHQSFFGEKPANFLVSLGYLILVCFLARTFYHWVERPIHHWSRIRLLNT